MPAASRCIPPAGDSEGGVRAVGVRPAVRLARILVGGRLAGGHGCRQPGPGPFKPLGADRGQPLAALPKVKRLLEGESARLKPFHYAAKLVPSLLVGKAITVWHVNNPTRGP